MIITPSKALFYFCISFVVGIGLASFFGIAPDMITKIPQVFIWGFLVFGVFLIAASFFIKKEAAILGFCMLFLALGIIRFQISEFNIKNDKLRIFKDRSEVITLTGKIIDAPDTRDSFQKIKVKIDGNGSVVLVTIRRYPEYNYLDKIKITGKLKEPIVTENFSYKNYLLKDGIYSVIDFPKIELLSKEHDYDIFSFLYEKILFIKEKLKNSIAENFSSPQKFIVEGVILGNDKNMPKGLKDSFNSAGLSHVTAVSGSNIVILISLLLPFLLMLGFWRGQAFYFSILFVWIYILMVGLPVSGVRAAIMGSCFLLAEKLGRQATGSRIIVLAVTIMLLQNPLLLLYDIGFQLSFLASMGIIHLKPIVDSVIKLNNNYKEKSTIKDFIYAKLNYLLDIISVTFSAQIFVLPIIIYNFGTISLVAPITNLLVLPIIPWLMIFGFTSAVLGIFSNFLGWVFYLPSWLLLTYFLKVLYIFYKSWAVVSIKNVSWIWLALYYLIIAIIIWYLNKKIKQKFIGY